VRRAAVARAAVALAAGVTLAAACRDALAPEAVAGRWALREVDGTPLPVVSFVAADATIRIVADTLRLDGAGRGVHVSVLETTHVRGPAPSTARQTTELGYRVVGDRVEITHVCPPDANCVPGPHLVGRRAGERLVLESPHGRAGALVYSAVGGR
jgi:hypothetical protein